MSVSSWKPNNIPIVFFELAKKQKLAKAKKGFKPHINEIQNVILYRRNFLPTVSSIQYLRGLLFEVYNGYDLFEKRITRKLPIFANVAASIITRETKVVHKIKLSKHARKNLQQKQSKKINTISKKKSIAKKK